MVEKTKKCSRCKKTKSINDFWSSKTCKGGYRTICKKCNYISRQNYRRNNLDKRRRQERKYKTSEKGQRVTRKSRLKCKYDLTLEEWQQMYNEQKGCCAICGIHQDKLIRSLEIDHNHVTGKVRKLLCIKCNLGLGYFGVDLLESELLEKAVKYIKETENG